tara:strand:+ start:3022 stop:3438 length:417 start_codon:yes stop_codon:yes gene_type:complete
MNAQSGLVKKVGSSIAVFSLVAPLVAGCVTHRPKYTPYPSSNVSAQQYNRDVIECQNWAASQSGANPNRAFNQGAQGAVGGAAVGALLGAIFGGRRGAGKGALAGAVVGGGAGGMSGSQNAKQVYNMAYNDCLRKKGL